MLPCDLADAAAVEALVPAAEAAMGALDILVNNAGVTRDNLFMRMKDEEWDTVIAVDLTAAFRLSRACLKGMMRRRFGRIIGITSIVGVTGNPGQGNYAAAKAGMIGMSKALAAEVASRGITVNCIAPGFIASPMTDALNDKQREAILASVPLGRLGAGADIGAAAVYLASDEAGLRHRPDPARQWRYGNDLRTLARSSTVANSASGLSPCLVRYAIEPVRCRRRVDAGGVVRTKSHSRRGPPERGRRALGTVRKLDRLRIGTGVNCRACDAHGRTKEQMK